MIARRPSRIAAKKAFDASELKEDSFQWQRLPAELRQTILVHVINNVLNRYLEPKHAKHKAATVSKACPKHVARQATVW